MSSHLLPVYFTTTKYNRKKKKRKFTKAHQDHEKWLKKMGVKKLSESDKKDLYDIPNYSENKSKYKTSDKIPGNGTSKDKQEYTVTKIMGIATMHKSNIVPVTNKKAAEDISKMRRG